MGDEKQTVLIVEDEALIRFALATYKNIEVLENMRDFCEIYS